MNAMGQLVAQQRVDLTMTLNEGKALESGAGDNDLEVGLRAGRNVVLSTLVFHFEMKGLERGGELRFDSSLGILSHRLEPSVSGHGMHGTAHRLLALAFKHG